MGTGCAGDERTVTSMVVTLCAPVCRFFQENGFLYVHTPIITASDCEGAGEMFQVSTAFSLLTTALNHLFRNSSMQ